ncbi:MAG: T9SS type B sorting domain-containing protein [Bacteroidota bacterium]
MKERRLTNCLPIAMFKAMLLLLFIWLLPNLQAEAQYTSKGGRFQVDQVKGCAPLTVRITNPDLTGAGNCSGTIPCLVYRNGITNPANPGQNANEVVYDTPGTYKLTILYQSVGADEIDITVDENIAPPFEVYACTGNGVSIKVTDNHYDQYLIDFNNDNVPENIIPFSNNAVAQFNYGTNTPQLIKVRGRDLNSADNCAVQQENFTPLAVLPTPTIQTLTALDATSLQLDFNVQQQIQYRLEIAVNNGNSFQLFRTLYETNTLTVPNLLLENNFYCFRLSAYDPCSNTNRYSNTICSADVDLDITNALNTFRWNTANTGVTNLIITRSGSDNTSFTTEIPFQNSYPDADIDCNIRYCYTLTADYDNGIRAISLEKCGTSFINTTRPAITNVTAQVDQGVTLDWRTDPLIDIGNFFIRRSTGTGPLTLISNTATPAPFTDANYFTEGAFCYQVNYNDLCGNNSQDGILTCPVRLFGSIDAKNIVTVNWSRYRGWQNGVASYVVEKYNQASNLIRTFNVGTDTVLVDDQHDLDNQVVSYRVRALPSQAGLTASRSNTVTFTKEINLIFPTAFTPNRDQLNDRFTVTGQYVAKMNMRIFDRWGTLVYASENNEPWDGTRGGLPMPEATYVWKAEITDLAGRTFSREGTLVLLRK